MSKEYNDIKHYTAEDIARYWDGKMSAQEMHALEAAAMDDPFLADALEGYTAVKPATIPADIEELRTRLNEKSRDRKVVPLPRNNKWWRVAAVLIFLGGASLLAYKLLWQENANKVAANQEADAQQAPVLQTDTITAGVGSTEQRVTLYDSVAKVLKPQEYETAKEGVNQVGNASVSTKTTEPVSVPELSVYKKEDSAQNLEALARRSMETRDSVFIAANDANKNAERLQNRVPGIQSQNQTNNRSASAEGNNQPYFNYFNGRVVDHQNNAIPFASVRLNNNQVTAANNEGIFQIKSADTVIDLSVSSVGYEPRNFTLRGNQPTQDVTLDRFSKGKMDEVVVVSGAARKKSAASKSSDKESKDESNAEPVNGWDEYNKYLQTSRRLDDANRGLKGEVIVTFIVNSRGELSDFAIEQSLGRWHDAEALRLVKEGPAWKLLKGKKARARVIVGF